MQPPVHGHRVNYAEAADCLCLCEWTHPAAIAAENSVLG